MLHPTKGDPKGRKSTAGTNLGPGRVSGCTGVEIPPGYMGKWDSGRDSAHALTPGLPQRTPEHTFQCLFITSIVPGLWPDHRADKHVSAGQKQAVLHGHAPGEYKRWISQLLPHVRTHFWRRIGRLDPSNSCYAKNEVRTCGRS